MSDTITTTRIEPVLPPTPAPPPEPVTVRETPVTTATAPGPSTLVIRPSAPADPAPSGPLDRPSSLTDQLARLEDKTARIEEKLARSEAATQRVVDRFEAASHRMSEVAQQSDLQVVRNDVRAIARRAKSLPGFAALILASVVTAVLAAVLMVAIIRYMPGLVVRP